MSDLAQLYRETILRHAGAPVGYGRSIEATHECEEHNPLCGDRIRILLRIADGGIEDAAFEGEACAICLASASLLCENLPGSPLTRLLALHDALLAALENDGAPDAIAALSPLLGVKPFPSRIRCATLPWSAARKALS